MKILLVTRGSQGDVLPYLAIAAELERRGHAGAASALDAMGLLHAHHAQPLLLSHGKRDLQIRRRRLLGLRRTEKNS